MSGENQRRRRIIKDSIDKATIQLTTAKELLQSSYGKTHYSDAIGAAHSCIELSVKGVFGLLGVPIGSTHGKGKVWLQKIANEIQERHLLEKLEAHNLQYEVRLPRLLFLMNHFGEFYLEAKYGIEAGHLASPRTYLRRETLNMR